MKRFFSVFAFLFPAVILAAEDPIKAELDKARAKHQEGVTAAKAKFVAAMDAKLKEIAGKSDLEGATQIKTQKELFEKDGTLPKSTHLNRARTDFESELRSHVAILRKAIESAKDSYTKALKLEEAQALAAELKAMGTGSKTNPVPAESPDDIGARFVEGSVWKGVCHEKKGTDEKNYDVIVIVTKRKGTAFEGTYDVNDGKFVYGIEGTIQKESFSFKYTKVEKQPRDTVVRNLGAIEHKGSIKLDATTKKPTISTTYTFRITNTPGPITQGALTLTLDK